MSTIPASTRTLSPVGVITTVRMMAAATSKFQSQHDGSSELLPQRPTDRRLVLADGQYHGHRGADAADHDDRDTRGVDALAYTFHHLGEAHLMRHRSGHPTSATCLPRVVSVGRGLVHDVNGTDD